MTKITNIILIKVWYSFCLKVKFWKAIMFIFKPNFQNVHTFDISILVLGIYSMIKIKEKNIHTYVRIFCPIKFINKVNFMVDII